MPLINFTMGLLASVAAVFIYLEVVTVLVDLASPVVFTTELRSWNPFINPVLKAVMIVLVVIWYRRPWFGLFTLFTPDMWTSIQWLVESVVWKIVTSWLFVPAVFGLVELIRLKKNIFG